MSGICGALESATLAEWLTGAGTLLLVFVTAVAVWVAWTQLRKFNENERTKVTLQYFEDYRSGKYQVAFAPDKVIDMTPDSAFGFCETLLNDEGAFKAQFVEGTPAQRQFVLQVASVAYNFAAQSAILLGMDKLDGALLMALLHGRFLMLSLFCKKLSPFHPDLQRRTETKGFRDLMTAALKASGVDKTQGPVPID